MVEVKIELLLEIINIFPSDMHAGMYLEKKTASNKPQIYNQIN